MHSPKQRGAEFQNKEEAGCASTRWLSLPPMVSSRTVPSWEPQELHLLSRTYSLCSVRGSADRDRVRSDPPGLSSSEAAAAKPTCASTGPVLGAPAPPFFGSTRLCLTNSSQPQTPGSSGDP